MKSINRAAIVLKALALVVLFATTSSFTGTWGGDHYKIYVNNKLVLEQFVYMQKSVQTISLNQRSVNDQVSVYYSHCGKAGTARTISIKDDNNKVVKSWSFADAALDAPMICKAKDILALHGEKLGIYYSSKELPAGKLLANVIIGKDNVVLP